MTEETTEDDEQQQVASGGDGSLGKEANNSSDIYNE